MKQKKVWITILLLIAILALGIGYALVSGVDLLITGRVSASAVDGEFDVKFTNAVVDQIVPKVAEPTDYENEITAEASVDESDPTKAYIDVAGLKAVGDKVVVKYTIGNFSTEYDAQLADALLDYDSEWYTVTCEYDSTLISKAANETTPGTRTATVTVELKVAPASVEEAAETQGDVSITITSTPVTD